MAAETGCRSWQGPGEESERARRGLGAAWAFPLRTFAAGRETWTWGLKNDEPPGLRGLPSARGTPGQAVIPSVAGTTSGPEKSSAFEAGKETAVAVVAAADG